MEKSRTYNSIVNSIYGIIASGITVVLNFFVRVVLVKQLGDEINGLHTLFQSIISVMAIMELGISSAMVIHLYQPVKEKNETLIKGIMSFYRFIYRIIAFIFAVITLFVAVFLLDQLVTTTVDIRIVRLYFLLFGTTSVLNYLTYYKRSILYAEQKNRISTAVNAICEVLFRSAQIVVLIIFKNYIYYLLLWIAEKVTSNLICNNYVNRHHPYLINNHSVLDNENKNKIFNTIKPLFVNQVAGTVRQSSRSILSSILLGNISIVGYYGNYNLVISMVEMVFSQFGGAVTSSFGNLSVEKNGEKMRAAFKRTSFVMNWIAAIMCAGFIACIQDFIALFFSKGSVLDTISVLSLLSNLVFYLITIPIISIQNAMGLHRLDAGVMVVQSITSIMLAYIGGKLYGMPGIFFGLLIPFIVFTFLRKGIIISECALEMKRHQYLSFTFYELVKIVVPIIVTALICSLIDINNPYLDILVKGIVALCVSIVVYPLMSLRSNEFRMTLDMIKGKVLRGQKG